MRYSFLKSIWRYYFRITQMVSSDTRILWIMYMIKLLLFDVSFTYIKISKDSLAKYYQDNKEKLQRRLVKDIKVFLKKKKKTCNKMGMNDIKSPWRWKTNYKTKMPNYN